MLNTSKIQFKSNSQLIHNLIKNCCRCAQYFKDTIQKQFTTCYLVWITFKRLCSILQRYNSKAIHNGFKDWGAVFRVVLNTSKIQFKSNSQLFIHIIQPALCCAQYFKDTIQKQFTTVLNNTSKVRQLCSILQRYNSKAIHNSPGLRKK